MEEDISMLLLIIWSQALAYCNRFWQVGVVTTGATLVEIPS